MYFPTPYDAGCYRFNNPPNLAIFDQLNLLRLRQRFLGSSGSTPESARFVNSLSKETLEDYLAKYSL